MHSQWLQSIDGDPSQVRPLGDYILVKRLPNDNPIERFWLPASVRRDVQQLRRGTAIAVGPGDGLLRLKCSSCREERTRIAVMGIGHQQERLPISTGRCQCGSVDVEIVSAEEHVPMTVKVGDEVLYWRSPANDVRINGEEYVFLHEEQHIVAVVEKGEANVSTVLA